MADVKICDRCGKHIEPTTSQKVGFGAWRYSIFSPGMSYKTHSDFDLCVDCGEKMTRFLAGAELAGEEVSNGT